MKILARIILVACAVFFLAEAYLRLTGRYAVYTEVNENKYITDYGKVEDSWYRSRTSNDSFVPANADFDYLYRTNAMGYRGENFIQTKSNSVIRILVTGDSFAEGVGAPIDSTWSRLLERILREKNLQVEVMNAGMAGSDILYDYVSYRDKLRAFKPDIIIASFNPTDYQEFYFRGGMERFHADGTTHYNQPPWYEPLYKHSRLLRAFMHKLGGYSIIGLYVSEKQYADSMATVNNRFADVFSAYREEAADNNAIFVAMVHATPGDIYRNEPIGVANVKGLDDLSAQLQSSNVACINITRHLFNQFQKQPPANYTYPHDLHFNSTGYAYMAHLIADSLQALEVFPQ